MGAGVQSSTAERGPSNVQPDSGTPFLTAAEVAALLRVSTMTVYRLIRAGDLASVRVGKSYRVRSEDVDRYIASRYTQAG